MPQSIKIPFGYCYCGCGQQTNLVQKNDRHAGLIKGQPRKYIQYHVGKKPGPDWIIDQDTECWLWQKGMNENGYGQLGVNGKTVYAHIFNYEQKYGPVPDGFELDHTCRNRRCCNPDHVEAVPHHVNTQRGSLAKLTEEDVRRIRAIGSSMTNRAVAAMFGVDRSQISRINTGKSWPRPGDPMVRRKLNRSVAA